MPIERSRACDHFSYGSVPQARPKEKGVQESHRAGHLAMPSPVVNRHETNLAVQVVTVMAVPRRRRRYSIRPNAPVRSAATLPKLAGSISGTEVGAPYTVSSGLTAYIKELPPLGYPADWIQFELVESVKPASARPRAGTNRANVGTKRASVEFI